MVDGLVRRMVRRRFLMGRVFIFVNLVVFEISALLRWMGRLFFDAALPLGAAENCVITAKVTKVTRQQSSIGRHSNSMLLAN